MQETSALYKELLSQSHGFEFALTIGESGRLIEEQGNLVLFGGFAILVASNGPESGYQGDHIISMRTITNVFSGSPSVGNCISGEIEIQMMRPKAELPRHARCVPYVRLTDGERHSEWIQKGVYFIDTRSPEDENDGSDIITIHGFDAMLMTEALYPPSQLSWPATDKDVAAEIATAIGVSVDTRTWKAMNRGYKINHPAQYSMRETLSNIAAMYGGNWFMTDFGDLRMATLSGIPKETRLLIDSAGFTVTFGGDRIRV